MQRASARRLSLMLVHKAREQSVELSVKSSRVPWTGAISTAVTGATVVAFLAASTEPGVETRAPGAGENYPCEQQKE